MNNLVTGIIMDNQENYNKAKKWAEEKIGFYMHLAAYVAISGLLIGINLTSSQYLWFEWPVIGWGIGVLLHGLRIFFFSEGSVVKERMINKELKKLQ